MYVQGSKKKPIKPDESIRNHGQQIDNGHSQHNISPGGKEYSWDKRSLALRRQVRNGEEDLETVCEKKAQGRDYAFSIGDRHN